MRRKMLAATVSFIVAGYILAAWPYTAFGQSASDITEQCEFETSSGSFARATDNDYKTIWKAKAADDQFVSMKLPAEQRAQGIWISWYARPENWGIRVKLAGNGEWVDIYDAPSSGYINEYVDLQQVISENNLDIDAGEIIQLKIYRQSYEQDGFAIGECKVIGEGELPNDLQIWQPTVSKADLMVVSAHSDDEFVFFGGTIPYYAGTGKDIVVVYMAAEQYYRRAEALAGLWTAGLRTYPVFADFPDHKTDSTKSGFSAWGGEQATVNYLVGILQEYRPDVVVSHDLKGEYVHGAHMATAQGLLNAIPLAADAGQASPWQVKKLYLHLFQENPLVIDWTQRFIPGSEQSCFDIAKEALQNYNSQLGWSMVRVHEATSKYSSMRFGLALSQVGLDSVIEGDKADFFENILTPTPIPTQTIPPTVQPMPTHTPELTAAPTQLPQDSDLPQPEQMKNKQYNIHWYYLAAAVVLIGVVMFWGIKILSRQTRAKRRH